MLRSACEILVLLLFASLTLAADCPAPTSLLDLERRLGKLEQAFMEIDPEALRAASAASRATLGCLGQQAPAPLVARLHRAFALVALDANNLALAGQSFASARSIEPNFVLPSTIATQTVSEVYLSEAVGRGATEALRPARSATVIIDGATSDVRALERPVIFQLLASSGEVLRTDYLLPGQATPTYEVVDEVRRKGVRLGLVVGGGAGLAAAGVLYGVAASIRTGPYPDAVAGWEDFGSEVDRERADALYQTNHTLVGASAALSGLALLACGLGVAVRW